MRPDDVGGIAEPVRAAWDHAVANWDDPVAHDEVLRLANVNICYAWVAAKYRERAAQGDEIAKTQQAKLRRAAEIQLVAGATLRREKAAGSTKSLRTMITMLVLVAAAGLIYAAIENQLDENTPSPQHRVR
ncbi:MAG TPA: hypothetical protein VGM88_18150 [Kofleriaceae bacterium]|jgi:hypothetical protein